jgi:hypothetical protein
MRLPWEPNAGQTSERQVGNLHYGEILPGLPLADNYAAQVSSASF